MQNKTLTKTESHVEKESGNEILLVRPIDDGGKLNTIISETLCSVKSVDNINQMIEYTADNAPSLVITEIFFDDIEPGKYLKYLRKQCPNAVIIIYSSRPERRKTADRRLGDIFEFLSVYDPPERLAATIYRALDYHKELVTIAADSKNVDKMRSQLEWLLWKQQLSMRSEFRSALDIIGSIKHFISQGMGVGSLVSLVEMMQMQMSRGANAENQFAMADTLFDTAQSVRDWLASFDRISTVAGAEYPAVPLQLADINKILDTATEAISPLQDIKGHKLVVEKLEIDHPILGNPEGLGIALRELITNAFKYSPENTNVNVTCYRTSNSYSLVVMNDILVMGGGHTGISRENEQAIFEPFYRLNNTYDDRFNNEEIGFGLGLTVVQNVMLQMGARLFVYEVNDFTGNNDKVRRVMAEMIFPITSG